MNNTFNANSLPQQQQHQNAPKTTTTQSIAYIPAHAHLPAHLNTLSEEQLGGNGSAFAFAARSLEKTFANYAAAPANRYYASAANTTTAAGLPNLTGAHNTILITNNFPQQNMPTILSATTTAAAAGTVNATNNNSNNQLDASTLRLPAGHFYPQQQQFSTHLNNFHNHFNTLAAHQQQQQQLHFGATTTTATTTPQPQHYFTDQLANVDNKLKASTNGSNNSTVVLDRINICINNHYNEALTSNKNNIDAPLTCSTTTTAGVQLEQQPSPVIPAIQHKATILTEDVAIEVIDEPDSTTTTAHTPPLHITDNNEQIIVINSPLHQSPSTTTAICTDNLKEVQRAGFKEMTPTTTIVIDCDENEAEEQEAVDVEVEQSNTTTTVAVAQFKIGEDVLLQRPDNRYYLGTVIGNAHEQYLLRFDDQSEQWCLAAEVRKLGGGGGGSPEKSIENNVEEDSPMCVACKLVRPTDVVECCERCGRGYHRGCTTEVYAGSNEWLCKR